MPVRFIVDQLTSMKNQLIYHSMLGEYKEYVTLRKEFAKKYITYPEEAKYITPANVRLSIFSKMGLNTLKTCFKELFRKKHLKKLK